MTNLRHASWPFVVANSPVSDVMSCEPVGVNLRMPPTGTVVVVGLKAKFAAVTVVSIVAPLQGTIITFMFPPELDDAELLELEAELDDEEELDDVELEDDVPEDDVPEALDEALLEDELEVVALLELAPPPVPPAPPVPLLSPQPRARARVETVAPRTSAILIPDACASPAVAASDLQRARAVSRSPASSDHAGSNPVRLRSKVVSSR